MFRLLFQLLQMGIFTSSQFDSVSHVRVLLLSSLTRLRTLIGDRRPAIGTIATSTTAIISPGANETRRFDVTPQSIGVPSGSDQPSGGSTNNTSLVSSSEPEHDLTDMPFSVTPPVSESYRRLPDSASLSQQNSFHLSQLSSPNNISMQELGRPIQYPRFELTAARHPRDELQFDKSQDRSTDSVLSMFPSLPPSPIVSAEYGGSLFSPFTGQDSRTSTSFVNGNLQVLAKPGIVSLHSSTASVSDVSPVILIRTPLLSTKAVSTIITPPSASNPILQGLSFPDSLIQTQSSATSCTNNFPQTHPLQPFLSTAPSATVNSEAQFFATSNIGSSSAIVPIPASNVTVTESAKPSSAAPLIFHHPSIRGNDSSLAQIKQSGSTGMSQLAFMPIAATQRIPPSIYRPPLPPSTHSNTAMTARQRLSSFLPPTRVLSQISTTRLVVEQPPANIPVYAPPQNSGLGIPLIIPTPTTKNDIQSAPSFSPAVSSDITFRSPPGALPLAHGGVLPVSSSPLRRLLSAAAATRELERLLANSAVAAYVAPSTNNAFTPERLISSVPSLNSATSNLIVPDSSPSHDLTPSSAATMRILAGLDARSPFDSDLLQQLRGQLAGGIS